MLLFASSPARLSLFSQLGGIFFGYDLGFKEFFETKKKIVVLYEIFRQISLSLHFVIPPPPPASPRIRHHESHKYLFKLFCCT